VEEKNLICSSAGVASILKIIMKSSYELAMERLNKSAPTVKLSARQKKELAELDSKYAAKIAEREIALKDEMNKLANAGDAEKMEQAQRQLNADRKNLQSDLEEKKDRVRHGKA
jgi:hypothetical protein